MTGDCYPTAAMLIWKDTMPEPAISLAFATTRMATSTERSLGASSKASIWHRRLGHAGHDAILQMRAATNLHDIPSTPAIHPDTLCDVCTQSKAITQTTAHPWQINKPLKLVLMEIMGPLYSTTQYSFVLIIHDAHSSMIWVQGLAHKGAAYQEAAWWLSKIHTTKNQRPSEVRVDQGELWSATFHELCSSMGVKISALPTQQHTNNAFAKWAIQTIQKIA